MRRLVTAADTLEMSVEERLELVGQIWDSISASPEAIGVEDDEREELDRRLQTYRDNPKAGDSWEVVRDRIQRQRRKG